MQTHLCKLMIGLFPKNDAPIATPVIAFSDKGISIILFC